MSLITHSNIPFIFIFINLFSSSFISKVYLSTLNKSVVYFTGLKYNMSTLRYDKGSSYNYIKGS